MRTILTLLGFVFLAGCAALKDMPKAILGTSTRALETARVDSIYQVYSCTFEQCFKAVTDVAVKNNYYISIKDETRRLIVLMAIPGSIDTTEVGVFFTETPKDGGVKVELSSRSSPAKRAVAKVLFDDLTLQFKK